jgi:hypothetical protein
MSGVDKSNFFNFHPNSSTPCRKVQEMLFPSLNFAFFPRNMAPDPPSFHRSYYATLLHLNYVLHLAGNLNYGSQLSWN